MDLCVGICTMGEEEHRRGGEEHAGEEKEWTNVGEITRLTGPEARLYNLDPFAVMRLNPVAAAADGGDGAGIERVKRRFRLLSRLVHPDRNPDDERAVAAFEVLNAAHKALTDPAQRAFCMEMVGEAREEYVLALSRRREERMLGSKGRERTLPEDSDPAAYERGLRRMVTTVFVEFEKQRQRRMQLDADAERREKEAAVAREAELAELEQRERAWEERRGDRVRSWHRFGGSGGAGSGGAAALSAARPAAAAAAAPTRAAGVADFPAITAVGAPRRPRGGGVGGGGPAKRMRRGGG